MFSVAGAGAAEAVADLRERQTKKTAPPTSSSNNATPPTAPAINAMSVPDEGVPAGAETDSLAVVALAVLDGVVELVVEPEVMLVVAADVPTFRLLHGHTGGTVAQICRQVSRRHKNNKNTVARGAFA